MVRITIEMRLDTSIFMSGVVGLSGEDGYAFWFLAWQRRGLGSVLEALHWAA